MSNSEKTDTLSGIRVQRWMLIFSATWPIDNASRSYNGWKYFIFVSVFALIIILAMAILFELDNIEGFNDVLSLLISVACHFVKHIIYEIKMKSFKEILRSLKDEVFFNYPQDLDIVMRKKMVFLHKVGCFYQTMCFLTMTILLVEPIIYSVQRGSFEPLYKIPLIKLGNWGQALVHAFETFAFLITVANNTSLDVVSGGFVTIAATHFRILNFKVRDCRRYVDEIMDKSKEVNKEIAKWLKQCVQHHLAILRIIQLIEDTFSLGYLAQMLASVIVLCNIGFQLVHANTLPQFIAMVLYMVSMLVQLSLYCYSGNDLMLKGLEISESCYFSDWINFNSSAKSSLLIIMERSKRPIFLTAGKFTYLSLETYKSILKTAYSCFAMMQTVFKRRLTEND